MSVSKPIRRALVSLFQAASQNSAEVLKKETDLETAKRPTSMWDRFTESVKTALGGPATAPSTTSKPSTGARKTSSSLISQPTEQNISTKTAVSRSRSITGERSAPAPTPYDAKPVIKSKPMFTSGESVGRAEIASGPPVGVGEKKSVMSTYVNLPKPVGKEAKSSVRIEGVPRRKGSKRSGDSQRQKNVSVYAKIPK